MIYYTKTSCTINGRDYNAGDIVPESELQSGEQVMDLVRKEGEPLNPPTPNKVGLTNKAPEEETVTPPEEETTDEDEPEPLETSTEKKEETLSQPEEETTAASSTPPKEEKPSKKAKNK